MIHLKRNIIERFSNSDYPQLGDQQTDVPVIPLKIRLQEFEAVENYGDEDDGENVDEESFFETRLVEIYRTWYWNPEQKYII